RGRVARGRVRAAHAPRGGRRSGGGRRPGRGRGARGGARARRGEAPVRKLFAIVAREWRAYFLSPLAYVILTAYMFLNGLIFSRIVVFLSSPGAPRERFLSLMFTNTYFWIFTLFIVPIITMRLIAEERKTGTLELLLTSPVSEATVVVGKFLGALGFFLV